MTERTRGARLLAVAVVAVQAGLLAAFFLAPRRSDWPLPGWLATVGSAMVLAGGGVLIAAALNLGRSLTPLPTPAAKGTLRTTGLYRIVRHPIYAGLLALLFGGALGSRSVMRLALAVAMLGVLNRKAAWEEDMLRRRYPEYEEYARRTPRFVPRFISRSNRPRSST
jgi:protein-S-isoprenylcysteine O-methyltransferase Ste14